MHRTIAAATLALAGIAQAHAQLAPCPGAKTYRPAEIDHAKDGPMGQLKLVPANTAKCNLGVPFTLEPGVTMWRCLVEYPDNVDPPEGAWSHATLFQRDGKPIEAFEDDVLAGRYEAFDLIRADLDGDGAQERVLALWNTSGNGMGVNSWTIHVFTADWKKLATFDGVQDWGRSSVVAAPKGRKGCDIAITSWEPSLNAKGVEGISMRAEFQQLRDGKFAEAADRPALLRRYTFAFQRERTATYNKGQLDEGDVRKWMSDKSVTKAP